MRFRLTRLTLAILAAACTAGIGSHVLAQTTPKALVDSARTDLRRYCKTNKPVGYVCPVDTLRLARASAALGPAPTPPPPPPPPPPVDTTALFSDSFESGFAHWSGAAARPDVFSITTTGCHTGSCVDIQLRSGGCCGVTLMELAQDAAKPWGASPYVRFWLKLPVGFLWGDSATLGDCTSACGTPTKILYLYGAGTSSVGYLDLIPTCDPPRNAGCPSASLVYSNDGDANLSGPVITPDGLWHQVELHPDNAAHAITVWWDGVQVIQGTSTLSKGSPYYDFKFGIYENNRWPKDQHLYLDDICIALVRCRSAQQPPTPTPVDTSKIGAVLAVVGPTIPVSKVPAAFAFYETKFKAYADTQWAAFGPRWDAGNSISGYERAAIYYTWWARTGDTTYRSRAHQTAVNYRDGYLVPAGFSSSPHWSQMESLYLDWLVTGDTLSRNAIPQVADHFIAFLFGYLTNTANPDLDQRIQARVIISQWMAEKVRGQPNPWLDTAIVQTLRTFNSDGWAVTAGACNGSVNYMIGMVYDALTRIYDQRPGPYNPQILSGAKAAGNYLWSKQWRGTANPADPSFNYLSVLCTTNPNGGGSPTSAPDLNGLMLPLFGWLGKTTGDATWFARGDQILMGMQGADLELYRQFSESYSSSFRYLGYRFGPPVTLKQPASTTRIPVRKP